MSGCMDHLMTVLLCLGLLLNDRSPEVDGESLIPTTAAVLLERFPDGRIRDFLPGTTILYMEPSGHRQWPRGTSAMLNRFSCLLCITRQAALDHFKAALRRLPQWKPVYRAHKTSKTAFPAPSPVSSFSTSAIEWACMKLRG